jgi:TniQ protein
MAVGMVPVHVPFAPRPIPGELCSSWVHRVAAANVLTVEELFEALRAHANDTLIGGLDYALAPATCASLAAWCRIPESMLRASDLQRAFPEASLDWFSQYTGDHALERFITPVLRPGFCAVCLGQQLHAGVATHVPAEWALACLTHCPHHRALLLSSCASCFRPDPLDLSLATTHRVPRCRFCDTALPLFVEREHDPAAVLFPLQRTILACLRGQPPSMNVVGPCTARTFVQLIADLVALVTARDAADTLVLADLLPNPANWSGRALRWRAHHRFATAPLADPGIAVCLFGVRAPNVRKFTIRSTGQPKARIHGSCPPGHGADLIGHQAQAPTWERPSACLPEPLRASVVPGPEEGADSVRTIYRSHTMPLYQLPTDPSDEELARDWNLSADDLN